ncbi:ABC TRANSPORTER G FAMILY MEMBER 31-LIKE [Salix koriyanagi]|uniref:ABC TRANSPORTER G FAMILY MEMBER 31-LIKE n=1 Tax=Salix koriyanagi TaxID=2511006 RepID=A0A9Q0X2P1_9ROSI|nr:ABC TRANSPORTER G FAMILY MEMBER 31-LIKE [Salix koriyanagi]
MAAASNGSEFFELDVDPVRESFSRPSNAESLEDDENELVWEAISRLPSNKRGNFAVMRKSPSEHDRSGGYGEREEMIDVRRLDRHKRELVVKKALDTNAQDNHKLLSAIKERLDRVGIEVPKVEVRFENLNISAKVQTGSRALPTLINVARDLGEGLLTKLGIFRAKRFPLTILNDISGAVKPGSSTFSCGDQATILERPLICYQYLSANYCFHEDSAENLSCLTWSFILQKSGNITYNGQKIDDFYVQRTSAYISQTDNHIAELTVRETLDFAACWQGASDGFGVQLEITKGYMEDLVRLEKEKNIRPNPEVDAFMKASSVGDIQTCWQLQLANNAQRWIKKSSNGNNTVGNNILSQHSLPSSDYWYWIGVGVLLLYVLVFNIIVTWALTYLNPLTRSRTVAPADVTPENSDGNDGRAQEFELKSIIIE